MKKTIIVLFTILTIVVPISAFAADWYGDTITLPRTGDWSTINRTAASDTQGTWVKKPTYDITSWIELKDGSRTGPIRYWIGGAEQGAQYHETSLKGATIHATFKSQTWYTNQVYLEWAP
ncbi:hypothetical protein ACQKM9_15725 [Viridibacillus sp. NPDC093762]|uniref:hypothetical protein n=1 Tax=Viridibacillus sp. NPDC093762 TaxID=3390720 RepID=UPI003CFF3DEF